MIKGIVKHLSDRDSNYVIPSLLQYYIKNLKKK